MLWFWIIFSFFFTTACELCLAQQHLLVPLMYMAGFYLTFTYGWHRTAIPFIVFSVLYELGFGRCVPLSMLIAPLLMFCASYWRSHGNSTERLVQILPGCLIGICAFAICTAYSITDSLINQTTLKLPGIKVLFQYAIESMIVFPFFTFFMDYIAGCLQLKKYTDAGKEWKFLDEGDE